MQVDEKSLPESELAAIHSKEVVEFPAVFPVALAAAAGDALVKLGGEDVDRQAMFDKGVSRSEPIARHLRSVCQGAAKIRSRWRGLGRDRGFNLRGCRWLRSQRRNDGKTEE